MSVDKSVHLSEDQLIMAIVEESDLPISLREHLYTCPQCRSDKVRFEQKLTQVGRMAKNYTPPSKRRISLPDSEPRSFYLWFSGRRAAFGLALTVAMLILVVWWTAPFKITPEGGVEITAREMQEAESFMTEISLLAENALPTVYMDINGESHTGFDEEFMQFIIPTINKESQSYDSGTKGVLPC
jgi:hypothetical protein